MAECGLEHWIADYVAGRLNDADAERLLAAVASDPAALAELRRAMSVDAVLRVGCGTNAWQRHFEQVQRQLDRQHSRRVTRRWAIAAGLVIGITGALICWSWPAMTGRSAAGVVTAVGPARVLCYPVDGGSARPVRVGEPLFAGDRLQCAAAPLVTAVQLQLWDHATARLAGDSELSIGAVSGANRPVTLHRGRVYIDSGGLTGRGLHLQVHTPFAQVTALGTCFEVQVQAGRTRVRLTEGRVVVTGESDQSSVELAPMQAVTVLAGQSPGEPVAIGRDSVWSGSRPAVATESPIVGRVVDSAAHGSVGWQYDAEQAGWQSPPFKRLARSRHQWRQDKGKLVVEVDVSADVRYYIWVYGRFASDRLPDGLDPAKHDRLSVQLSRWAYFKPMSARSWRRLTYHQLHQQQARGQIKDWSAAMGWRWSLVTQGRSPVPVVFDYQGAQQLVFRAEQAPVTIQRVVLTCAPVPPGSE